MSIANTKGVDISYAQGDIDLSKVKKAGYGWVMIRCGQGGSGRITDDWFSTNVKKAEALGMPWGAYLFTEACSTEMIKDEVAKIDKLLKAEKAKGYKPTLPIALDIENERHIVNGGGWNKSNVSNIAAVYVKEMKALGYYPMLYTGYYELRDWINSDTIDSCDIWLAQYNIEPDWEKNLCMWQFSDGDYDKVEYKPLIDGFSDPIDKDIVYKDYPTIIKNGGYNGWGKGSGTNTSNTTQPSNTTTRSAPDVIYKVRAGGTWLPEVKNFEDYAGLPGKAITDVAIKVSKGSVKYQVHVKGGKWLNWITKYDTSDLMGYAGNGNPIDAIKIYYYTPSDIIASQGYYRAQYRVAPLSNSYFDYQYDTETTDGQDGYAGDYGKSLDKLQIKLSK